MPRDHGVGGSGGDAGEGDRLLVVGGGVEGLLEHRQHRRDCGDGERQSISNQNLTRFLNNALPPLANPGKIFFNKWMEVA